MELAVDAAGEEQPEPVVVKVAEPVADPASAFSTRGSRHRRSRNWRAAPCPRDRPALPAGRGTVEDVSRRLEIAESHLGAMEVTSRRDRLLLGREVVEPWKFQISWFVP